MPKVIDVQPKDIYVLVEFPIAELKGIHNAMSRSKIEYNGEVPEEAESAKHYNKFWDFLDNFLKEVQHGTGPHSP